MIQPNTRFLSAVALFALLTSPPAQEIARAVPPGREVRDHKLLTLGKTDRWDLTVQKGEVLWCKVDSHAFDPVLELVDGEGNVLAKNDGHGTRSEIWLRTANAGEVAFRVRGYEGAGGGLYNFWLQRYKTQDLEPGDSATHRFGRERWWHYVVPLKKGDILVPAVTGHGRLTAVYDFARQNLAQIYGGYRVKADGLHFVRVEGSHRRTCTVALGLARQRALPEDGRLRDELPPHGLDVWRLQLRPFEPQYLPLSMFDTALQWNLFEVNPPRNEGRAFAWTGSMDRGGLRRRWLMPRRHCTIEFFLKNNTAKPARYSGSLRPAGEILPEGKDVKRTLPLCGGQLFRLRTNPGELIRLRACSEMFDAQIDVWDRAGNVIHQNDDTSLADPNPSLTFPVTSPGDHWVLVFCPGGTGSGPFDLRMDSLPIPTVRIGTPAHFDFAKAGTKYAHLVLQRDDEFWLSLRSRQFDAAVTVLAPNGKNLGTYDGGGIDKDVLIGMRAPQSGRYTLRIHGRDKGRGTLKIVKP